MSKKKQKVTSASKAVGAAVVALSGFVPMPTMHMGGSPSLSGKNYRNGAIAATLPIAMSGSALTGIAMAGPANLKFGTIVATAVAGTFPVTTGGGVGGALAGAKAVANQANGAIGTYTALVTAGADITIAGIGVITLTGAGATGTVKLATVNFANKLGAVALKMNAGTGGAGATSAKKVNYVLSSKAGVSLKMGGTLKWVGLGTPPVGQIPAATAMTITITY